MKKSFKTIVLVVLACVMACSMLIGCKKDGGGSILKEYKDRPNKVKVLHFKGGFGDSWLVNTAKYYMDNIDKETYIDIKNTAGDGVEGIKLAAGVQTHDVYLLSYRYTPSTALTYLADLSDIYNGKSTGEDVLVKDKMSDTLVEAYVPRNGKVFELPFMSKTGYSFCYNKTVLDNALGVDKYRVPRTTDEMFEVGDKLKEKNVYLTASAFGDATDYIGVEEKTWLAQILGAKGYAEAIKGNYKADDGSYVLSEDAPRIITDNEDAIKAVFNVFSKFGTKANGYVHKESSAMNYLDIEGALAGIGFGYNKAQVAFLYSGQWLTNEMSPYLKIMEESGKPQEIRAEKMPLISAVRAKTSIVSDEVLREVVDFVDGVTKTAPSGVSEADIEFIKSSRSMVGTHLGGTMAIGKKTTNLEGSKNFLRFLTSDVAQKISNQATNGIEMLPYGHDMAKDNLQLTDFMNDMLRISKGTTLIDQHIGLNNDFIRYGGFNFFPYAGIISQAFNSPADAIETVDAYYDRTVKFYGSGAGSKWATVISNYKKAMGL